MLKWFLTLTLAVFVLGLLTPLVPGQGRRRRLPGDIQLRWRGREYQFPLGSTLVLSLVLTLLTRVL